MKTLFTKILFMLMLFINPNLTFASNEKQVALASDIILTLETPAQGSVLSGVSNFQGWVISSTTIKTIELFVDDKFIGNIPHGGTRRDVGNAYPQYPNSNNAGFSMAFTYSLFKPGKHTAKIRAIDINGYFKEVQATFNTIRFNDITFLKEAKKVDLYRARAIFPNKYAGNISNQVLLQNVEIDNELYSILLVWNIASQKFEFHRITHQ